MTLPYVDDDEQSINPLDGGAAGLPTIIGGGCLSRFDPEDLNADSGADFSALWPSEPGSTDTD